MYELVSNWLVANQRMFEKGSKQQGGGSNPRLIIRLACQRRSLRSFMASGILINANQMLLA